jgi:hypothetical protein
MYQSNSVNVGKQDKTMNSEQFQQIVEAIMAGKYSWACVLMLNFTGYNPLHFIPYRTYNRLQKENCQVNWAKRNQTKNQKIDNQASQTQHETISEQQNLSNIKDLAYLDFVGKQKVDVVGGCGWQWLTSLGWRK